MVSIPVRVLDVLKQGSAIAAIRQQRSFNPCKGFRCFEAHKSLDPFCREFVVSIPVRVLDVLKPDCYPIASAIRRFNPCKGFRCFEAPKPERQQWRGSVSIPVRVLDVLKHAFWEAHPEFKGFNPCKGFRCFEARRSQGRLF